jgi:hypothetical protein
MLYNEIASRAITRHTNELDSFLKKQGHSYYYCKQDEIRNPLDGKCVDIHTSLGIALKKLYEKRMTYCSPPHIIYDLNKTFNGMTLETFVNEYIIQKNITNVDDFLYDKSGSIDTGYSGKLFETLWKVCILFGCHPFGKKYEARHAMPNGIDEIKSMIDYLRTNKVFSGAINGYSDIALYSKDVFATHTEVCDPRYNELIRLRQKYGNYTDEYILISVKYFKKEKRIDEYDIYQLVKYGNDKCDNRYKTWIFCNDKDTLISKIKNITASRSSYIIRDKIYNKDDDTYNILDKTDLQQYFTQLKNHLSQYTDITEYYNQRTYVKKPELELRFHQELFVMKTINILKMNNNATVLWGAIARSGKTFIMGGLIRELTHVQYDNRNNYLIITPRPEETIVQYTDDLFNKYSGFETFDKSIIILGKNTMKPNLIKNQKNNIFIVSSQYLKIDTSNEKTTRQNRIKPNNKKIEFLKKFSWTAIFYDEAHIGGGSLKTRMDIIDAIKDTNTSTILITATYDRPEHSYNISKDNVILWDLQDLTLSKQLSDTVNRDIISSKHGIDNVNAVIDKLEKRGYTLETISREYQKFPQISVLTTRFDIQKINDLLNFGHSDTSISSSFNIQRLFSVSDSEIVYKERFAHLLNMIAGSRQGHYLWKEGDGTGMSFYDRILYSVKKTNSRPILVPGSFTTQLWFLPHGNSSDGIDNIAPAVIREMSVHPFLEQYDVKYIGDKNEGNIPYKMKIREWERDAKNNKKRGLIILSGTKLSVGISIPCCDIVVLLNDLNSYDTIFQMMFRSLTESINKKMGFIVDINPFRIIQSIIRYSSFDKSNEIDEIMFNQDEMETKLNDILTQNILFLDEDKIMINEVSHDEFNKNLYEFLRPMNVSDNTFITNIRDMVDIKRFNKDEINLLKNFLMKWNVSKPNKKSKGLLFDNAGEKDVTDMKDVLDTSISEEHGRIVNKKTKKTKKNDITDDELRSSIASFMHRIIMLASILVSDIPDNNSKRDIESIFETIHETRNKPDCEGNLYNALIEYIMILNSINKISKDEQNAYVKFFYELLKPARLKELFPNKLQNTMTRISHNINKEFNSLIDNKEKLLQYIHDNLTPKKVEKKKYGEVFTSMNLIGDMISKIPDDAIHLDMKVLDTGSGMGNFTIAMLYKLSEHTKFKTKYPVEMERRRYILENNLYMVELNKKNVELTRKIFRGYKINIFCESYLSFDPKKIFGIDKFDLIIGNPPYQSNVGRNGTLWDRFVIYALSMLKNDGYLLYVHPSGWRDIDGKFKHVQKEILSRNLLYLEIHNEKDGLSEFQCETRYDWYILQNRDVKKTNTLVRFQDGTMKHIDVHPLDFIPNEKFDKIRSLYAKEGEEKLNLIHSYYYDHRRPHMSEERTRTFRFPIIYTVNSEDKLRLNYSSEENDYFKHPKLVWSNGRITSVGSYIDKSGIYGLSPFSYAIVDRPSKLNKIKQVFDSPEFRNLMEACAVGELKINYKILEKFKKDCWEYIDISNTNSNTVSRGGSQSNTVMNLIRRFYNRISSKSKKPTSKRKSKK